MKTQLVLPSASSAMALVQGEPNALPWVTAHLLGRACLIGVGIYAMGGGKATPKLALGGSLAIEAFVLYCAWQQSAER